MVRWCLAPALWLALVMPAAAETLGDYVHGTARHGDGKIIVCYDLTDAVTLAEGINLAFGALREALLAAPDEDARQAIYDRDLTPAPGWQALMAAVDDERCSLIATLDHTSTRTIMAGPDDLAPLGVAHSVVESEMLHDDGRQVLVAWIVTTQAVPPPQE